MKISNSVALLLFLTADFSGALAADRSRVEGSFVIAQTSMGGSEATPSMPPPVPSVPSTPPAPRQPRMDYIPSLPPSQPAPKAPDTSTSFWWGAIGFTADGSYSTVWKMASQPEAEASVAKKCAEYGHGACKVVSFSGPECIALSTFNGTHKRSRWNLSFTAGGNTYPEATRAAMDRCNADERSRGRCNFRVAACADGR